MTDLIGIFNADSRTVVSKFAGLRWFPFFEDLYNGREGSLQANKTSKKKNLNLKQLGNKGTSKLQPISLISYLSKKKKSRNKSVKLRFYYSTQKYDSITRYFPFSKKEFPKKSNVVFT